MPIAGIGQGLGLGGGTSATSSGAPAGGAPFENVYSLDMEGSNMQADVDSVSLEAKSFAIWFKPDSSITPGTTADIAYLVGGDGGAGTPTDIGIILGGNQVTGTPSVVDPTIMFYDGNNMYAYVNNAFVITAAWHHFAAVWNAGSYGTSGSANGYDIFYDGTKIAPYTSDADGDTTPGAFYTSYGSGYGVPALKTWTQVRVGNRVRASARDYKGVADEFAMWDDTLSAAEVTQIYNSGTPFYLKEDNGAYTSSGDLIAYWRMGDNDGGTGDVVSDQAGSNDLALTNGAAFVEDVP